jgi:hypothetical protein
LLPDRTFQYGHCVPKMHVVSVSFDAINLGLKLGLAWLNEPTAFYCPCSDQSFI